jgi:hypothetical protein
MGRDTQVRWCGAAGRPEGGPVPITDPYPTLTPELTVDPTTTVAFDAYRDIHKGIRAELFAAAGAAGNLDPADRAGRAALAAQVRDLVDLLIDHSHHEDAHVHPVLEAHVPALFERLTVDHADLEGRGARIAERTADAIEWAPSEQRARVHNVYLDIASFTSAYLAHQEIEERIVMPAVIDAIGVEGAIAIHQAIVGSIPPKTMAKTLAVMLPAMNLDDRAELLGGMQHGAPPEVFASVWGLTGSVLAPTDHRALAARIGLG